MEIVHEANGEGDPQAKIKFAGVLSREKALARVPELAGIPLPSNVPPPKTLAANPAGEERKKRGEAGDPGRRPAFLTAMRAIQTPFDFLEERNSKTPTAEQAAVLKLPPRPGLVGLIDAIAGSGKTSVLEVVRKAISKAEVALHLFQQGAGGRSQVTVPPQRSLPNYLRARVRPSRLQIQVQQRQEIRRRATEQSDHGAAKD